MKTFTNTLKKVAASIPVIFIFFTPLMLSFLAAPSAALAQSSANIHSNVWSITTLAGPLVTCVGAAPAAGGTPTGGVTQTCTSFCDLVATAANVVYFAITLVIWIIAPLMFLWAGILFMISTGSAERTGQARKMITGTVIGLLIVLCAYLIVTVFVGSLGTLSTYIGGFGTAACQLN